MTSSALSTAPLADTTASRWLHALTALMILVTLAYPFVRVSGFLSQEVSTSASYTEGSLLVQLVYGPTFLAAGLICWRYGKWTVEVWLRSNLFLLALTLWALASVLWSPYPTVTLKRSIQLIGLVLVGTCLALPQLRATHWTRILCSSLTTLLTISLLFVILMPHIAVDTLRDDGWRGILWHKNLLGMAACFATLLWLYRGLSRDTPALVALTGMTFTFFMVVMSRSSTALVTCLFGCLVYLFFRRHYIGSTQQRLLSTLYLLIATLAGGLIFFTIFGRLPSIKDLLTPIIVLLGKDPDLTGRTDIWQLVLMNAYQYPLQGIGYGAFWLGAGSPSQYIIDILHWVPLQAHNGYVDILNELGVIGFGLFSGLIIWHTVMLTQLMRFDREQAALHWAFFLMTLLSNLSESQFFRGLMFQSALFIFSVLIVANQVAKHRAESLANPG